MIPILRGSTELLDIFLLASQRGGIHLHEFDTIQTVCQFIEEITS